MLTKVESTPLAPASKGAPDGALLATLIVFAASLTVWHTGHSAIGLCFVIASAAFVYWRNGARVLGMSRPASWPRVIGWSIAGLVVCFVLTAVATPLVLARFAPPDMHTFASLRGNGLQLVRWLAIAWTSAAFGEEIIFRAGLLQWVADRAGGRVGAALGVVVSALVFGLSHAYQGMSGVLLTGLAGLVFGLTFLAARRTLWASIITHGLFDSVALVLTFLGLNGR